MSKPDKNYIFLDLEMNPTGKAYRETLRQEIIQIGAVRLDSDYKEIDSFMCYVKPVWNDHIDKNIEKLTGITDEDVEDAESFSEAIQAFLKWRGADPVYCWSDSDERQVLKEAETKGLGIRIEGWHDLQKEFGDYLSFERQTRLSLALEEAGLVFPGKKHNALDDARATAKLFEELKAGHTLKDLKKKLDEGRKPIGTSLGSLLEGIQF